MANDAIESATRSDHSAAVNGRVSAIAWGYVVHPERGPQNRADLAEVAATFGCMLLGAAAFGQWLVPGATSSIELVPFKIAGTAVFFVFSLLMYLMARRGFAVDLQIDAGQKEVRLVRRNRHGQTTLLEHYAFAGICDVEVKNVLGLQAQSGVFLELYGQPKPVRILTGSADDMATVRDRIISCFGPSATASASRETASNLKEPQLQSSIAAR